MIISVTHEIVGQESILRISPPQIFDGNALALKVLNIELLSTEMEENELKIESEHERAENLCQQVEDKRKSIKDAILKLDDILVEKPNNPEMMKIIEVLRNDLRKAHE